MFEDMTKGCWYLKGGYSKVSPKMLNGFECWTVNKKMEQRSVAEMRYENTRLETVEKLKMWKCRNCINYR